MNNQWIKTSGKLIVRPSSKFSLRKKRNIDEAHTIVQADRGLAEYTRWWVDKQLHLWLQPPMLQVHVSVFNGKETLSEEAKKHLETLNGSLIEYEYSVDVQQHWKFWVLPVRSEMLNNIRGQCNVPKNYHFHITIGRML